MPRFAHRPAALDRLDLDRATLRDLTRALAERLEPSRRNFGQGATAMSEHTKSGDGCAAFPTLR